MGIYATQRNATRNQSTVDYEIKNLWLYNNRYQDGVFVNNLGEDLEAQDGILVVRNAGTYETSTVEFVGIAEDATMILGALTFTASRAITGAELAAAFANLSVGATTGGGTAYGAYSGTFTGWSTGAVVDTDKVVFTASALGNVTNLAATGTGTAPTIVTVAGTAGTVNGFSPATSANLANVIGILKIDGVVDMADAATTNAYYGISGDIDTSLLILPNGVNLNTIVGSKALKDVLTDLGFVLFNVNELSKFGN